MPADRVVIEELFIKLPGLSVDAARDISREVAERLGHGLAAALPSRSLGALDVRLELRPGASRDEIIDRVTATILGALAR